MEIESLLEPRVVVRGTAVFGGSDLEVAGSGQSGRNGWFRSSCGSQQSGSAQTASWSLSVTSSVILQIIRLS